MTRMTGHTDNPDHLRRQRSQSWLAAKSSLACLVLAAGAFLVSCGKNGVAKAGSGENSPSALPTVGVTKLSRKPMARYLTLSSELVPFQEDRCLRQGIRICFETIYVDYGTRVKAGQLMAILEIPELQAQLEEDKAADQELCEKSSQQ